ncbi:hypothetical protein D9613_009403 [Agrocybe pediades]|uniref:Uncharacterized protein n=1 Tax=Agrocybe pediades TaxID=84607 RepID=A0A8H4R4S0_9AGAR|nr:hypothetical protein D9613_009403 [Agrocybe pediades]KAF9557538.1 hypothetical protein CPC08DRAFT_764517 [Agrocybe pediades]
MKQFFAICLIALNAFSLAYASSCTCSGKRTYDDVAAAIKGTKSKYFGNGEGFKFALCPGGPFEEFVLSNSNADRAIFSGGKFCGCVTHEGAQRANGFALCRND